MYKKEEVYEKCRVALCVLEVAELEEPDRETMVLIAQDYLRELGGVIGISLNR